ncbi:MAG: hypothetical protein ACK4MS_15405 [Paracoccaceae bacterium]
MRMVMPLASEAGLLTGWTGSVLLASASGDAGETARTLAAVAGRVMVQRVLYDALSLFLDDPREADMLVIECDPFGGLAAGRRAFAILSDTNPRLPVVLISAECQEQTFPLGRDAPYCLRSPVSEVALRIALSSAFPILPGGAIPRCRRVRI